MRLRLAGAFGLIAILVSAAAWAQVPAGPDFRVNTYTTFNQGQPAITSDAAGNFVVVWHSYIGVPPMTWLGIFGQRYSASGVPLGTEFELSTYTPSDKVWPVVSSDADGDFVAAWTSYPQDGSGTGVFAQRFDKSGSPQGVEFRVNSYTPFHQGNPSIAATAGGDFVVAWQSTNQNGSDTDVFVRRFDAAGTPQANEFRVNTYTPDFQGRPDVAVDAGGDFVVAWDSHDQDGSLSGVYAQRFDAAGAPRGGEFRVNTYTTSSQYSPAVASDAGGSFVVAWVSDQDGSSWGVFGQRFDASGTPRGAEFRVNTYTTGYQSTSAIASDASGNFIVSWNSNAQDGSLTGVFAQRFDASGARRGAEFRVNSYTTDHQWFPVVAADAVGNLVVAWQDHAQGWTNRDVTARRFGGLVPTAVGVDTDPGGNVILEPAETVDIRPSWHNQNGAAQTFGGSAVAFSGPAAAGVTYQVPDATASYGTVASDMTAQCADCYRVSIGFGSARPSVHWDSTLDERITPDAHGQHKNWTLHVGRSFNDVAITSPFYRFVETLLHRAVTGGCSGTDYCPSNSTTREQMAVFVLVAKEGTGYAPAACTTPVFADVPASSPFCRWIEELVRRGVVSGCGGGNYCPTAGVTREEMAVFVLRTLDGTLNPPACTTPMFNDVPASSPFCAWIEELARRGVVTGCGGGDYCPTVNVTREQMGVFISVTFGLTLYGP
jgi:hypothetical protein